MKLATPSPYRAIILYRVICASAASSELNKRPKGGFSQAYLANGLAGVGLKATLAEYSSLIESLFEIYALDVTNKLNARSASSPHKGLTIERELELLKELVSRNLVARIIGIRNVAEVFAEMKKNRAYAAIGMQPHELSFVAVTAMNEHAARFQAKVEALFE